MVLNSPQKNFHGGLMVFKQMKGADIQPDSQTYSYLISNCNREEDIIEVVKKHYLLAKAASLTCKI